MAHNPEHVIPIGVQRDMRAIERSLQDLSLHASRVVNIPAFDQSDEQQNQRWHFEEQGWRLEAQRWRIEEQIWRLEAQRLVAMDQRLGALISPNDKNLVARAINNSASGGDSHLELFYGPNRQLIPNFPETAGQAMRLEEDQCSPRVFRFGYDRGVSTL